MTAAAAADRYDGNMLALVAFNETRILLLPRPR